MNVVSCKECNTDVELEDPKEDDGCCQDCGAGPFCVSCKLDVHECGDDEVDDEDDESEDEDEEEASETE